MVLLLPDDDANFEALDAALSFVDAYISSPAVNGGTGSEQQQDGSSSDDAMLGDELDELLRVTLSPSPSTSSTSGGEFTSAETHPQQLVLPSPLAPLTDNLKAPDVAKVKENGRLRVAGGCRNAHCQAVSDTGKDKPKKRIKR
ncbi:hypothetical protein PC118_g8911 [Phytophthora cactorum]|uniref:Uncharacterized protein n=1 Tax=Phytophthora cactorum TaxID=29920 RepID=A0A8T1FWY2_9STRA|nr:hypothetical protein PC118_g8911 [Phytophthora cactorum]